MSDEKKRATEAGSPRPSSSRGDSTSPDWPEGPTLTGRAYGDRVGEKVRHASHAGRLADADGIGVGGSQECGSLVTVELRVQDGVISEARYQAYGCPATLASAETVCEFAEGGDLLSAARLSEQTVCTHLGLRPAKRYTATNAMDALHMALGCVLSRALAAGPDERSRLLPSRLGSGGILVGMSGGVDSGYAALRLREAGLLPVGITLRLWTEEGVPDQRSCCSMAAVRRAREIAHSLGMPHFTLDASEAFRNQVVTYFVTEYARGRTPNPCAKCNARLRFTLLTEVAHLLGLEGVATGHYARLTGSRPCLTRGVDARKDQSYVLAEVSPEVLSHYMFPLGGLTKTEVRAAAAKAGLKHHSTPESQEICFVPDGDHRRFLRHHLGELPGEVVDSSGKVLGTHAGTYNFTIGQRRGVGIGGGQPLYVVQVDGESRRVVVGPRAETAVRAVYLESLVFHPSDGLGSATIQVRSSGPAVPVREVRLEGSMARVTLARPAYGVAPGQTGVIYQGPQVWIAGTIAGTEP